MLTEFRANSRANNYVEFRTARYDRVICNFEKIMRVHDFRSELCAHRQLHGRSWTVNSRFDDDTFDDLFRRSARPFPLVSPFRRFVTLGTTKNLRFIDVGSSEIGFAFD